MQASDTKNGLSAKKLLRVVVVTAFLLMIPFLAMQFNWQITDPGNPNPETVDWNLFDFIVMGILLMGVGFAYELLALRAKSGRERAVVAVVLLAMFFLVWAELAVGIFGSPIAGS